MTDDEKLTAAIRLLMELVDSGYLKGWSIQPKNEATEEL